MTSGKDPLPLERWRNETPKEEPFHLLAERASPSPEDKNGHEGGESSREDTMIEDSKATSGVENVDVLH
jgi:hypothetical protein